MRFWQQFMGSPLVRYARNHTTNAAGVSTFTLPDANLLISVLPRTAGEFMSSIAMNGNEATVTFRKVKTSGLGITLGTLLSVSIFEDSPGAVNFDVICSEWV